MRTMDLSNSISDYANTVLLGLIIIYVGCARGWGGGLEGQGFQLVIGDIIYSLYFFIKKGGNFFLGCAVLKLLTCIGYCCTTNSFLLALKFCQKV